MTLTVATGTPSDDAFVSVAACDAYCLAHGLTWAGEQSAKEAAIRRATAYLSSAFTWKGCRTNGRSQALSWPRTGVADEEGNDVPSDEIPVEIVGACCEVAVRELASPGVTAPDVVMTDRVKREKAGPLEVEYASTPASPEAARPVLTLVMDKVGGLLATGTNSLVGMAVRA